MSGGLLGYSYAFTLGLLAAVNPCGFAMLPMYVSQFAATDDDSVGWTRRIGRAVAAAGVVATGFVVVFAAVGMAVTAGMAVFMRWVPWAMVVIAAALVMAGVAGLAGRLSVHLPQLPLSRSGRSARSMFVFGVGYALASLSCALPVFLAGVAGAFLQNQPVSALADLLAYAVGMGVLLTGVNVAITVGGTARLRRLRRLSRWLAPSTSLLLILAGGYLLYYWITYLVAPQRAFPFTGVVDDVQASVAGWLGVAGVWAGIGIAAAIGLTLLALWLRRRVGAVAAALLIVALPGLLVPAGLLIGAGPAQVTASAGADSPMGVGSAVQLLTALTPLDTPAPAPPASLLDQHGNRVSLVDYRGKAVVLAFLDDRCQDICRLYSPDMLAAARRLGSVNQRVEFVGINVNARHTRVSDVAAFTRREGLTRLPNWHFLTGSAAQLRRIWRAYGEFVGVRGSGVTHQGVLWFLDPQGRERAVGSFGASSQATDRWGLALATITRALLGLPVHPPTFATLRPGDSVLRGVNVTGDASAPDVTLPLLLHPSQRLSLAALRGRPVVVNFWASWCPPCQRELPALQAESTHYRGRVTFVGIDIDDQASSARQAAIDAGLTYDLLEDAHGRAATAYRVVNLPTTVLITPDGMLALRHTGAISRGDLSRAIDGLGSNR